MSLDANTYAVEEPDVADVRGDDLTRFQVDVLAALRALGSVKGLAVRDRLEERYDDTDVHHGRLYPNLDELVDHGLVEKGTSDQRTNSYELTDAAEAALDERADWLRGDRR